MKTFFEMMNITITKLKEMKHDTYSRDCWCCPTLEYYEKGKVCLVIHNSKAEAN